MKVTLITLSFISFAAISAAIPSVNQHYSRHGTSTDSSFVDILKETHSDLR